MYMYYIHECVYYIYIIVLPELYRATVWWSCPLHCDAWFVNIAGMCYLIGSEGERKGGRDGERRVCIHVRIREKQTLLINHLILIWIIILPRVYSWYYIRIDVHVYLQLIRCCIHNRPVEQDHWNCSHQTFQ